MALEYARKQKLREAKLLANHLTLLEDLCETGPLPGVSERISSRLVKYGLAKYKGALLYATDDGKAYFADASQNRR